MCFTEAATEATEQEGEGTTMRRVSATAAVLALILASPISPGRPGHGAVAQEASPAAGPAANKEVARRVSQEIWSSGDVALIDQIIAPDYVRHGTDAEFTGREALATAILGLRAAIPDWTETIEDIIGEGDLVAYRYTGRGTYQGQLPGLPPPAGQPIVLEGNAIHRIVGGQVIETWSVFNQLPLQVQLGVMSAPPAATPFASSPRPDTVGEPADAEANKAIVRRLAAAFDAGDWAALDAVLAPDVVDHYPDPGQGPGIEGMRRSFAGFKAGFPDLTCPTEALLAEGDRVALRTTCTGTHTAEWTGVPPSGASVTMPVIAFYRVVDGKITDRWAQVDGLGLLMQIGAIPPAAGPEGTPAA
jgi:steroid delta-isomerase-like uncharacterized protein